MLSARFDSEKAIESILYVASTAPISDIYHVGKILYFADRLHLERYGRLITGDNHLAMKDGPVAENAYDIIKVARGDGRFIPNMCFA
ncbi:MULTISPECIES: Panacea domain-containing protein [unclassified Photorhabdus]|uniref:Panacea domain-containing protein n=1 Tax=unclassified Photorhabdus TaxID=2620880 RepID=UPI0021033DAA|nr:MULTISPECIES: Panacea domain-containing protein [unclassified Photorhabdus]